MAYSLLAADKKIVGDARSFVRKQGNVIAKNQQHYREKGWLGLWWDSNRFFESSNQEEVVEHMERYRELYDELLSLTDMVDKCDEDSYKNFLSINQKLEEMEREAGSDIKNSKSKAIVEMLREFIESKYELDNRLKRVECVSLQKKVEKVEEICQKSQEAVEEITQEMKSLFKENQEFKVMIKDLFKENMEFKMMMKETFEENQRTMRMVLETMNEVIKKDKGQGGNKGPGNK